MISVGNLIHRGVVFGCIGFGVYGTAVIAQNFVMKVRAIKEENAQKAAIEAGAAAAAEHQFR